MRVRSFDRVLQAQARSERTLPPGTGFIVVGGASLVIWAAIAGIAILA